MRPRRISARLAVAEGLKPDVVSSNIELVRRAFAAVAAWDVDALRQLYHREIELLPLTGTRIETGGYRGHEGVRAYMQEAHDLWDVLEPQGDQFHDLGDRVLVVGHRRVRGRSSGAEDDPACCWVIGLRDGLIDWHRACASYEEAAQAAGVESVDDESRSEERA